MPKDTVRKFIINLLHRNKDYAPCSDDESLIHSNRIDSLDIAELVIFLQNNYDIYVLTSDPDVFNELDSINLIVQYIQNAKEQ
ncbi:hypothetical protein [Shewanella dokdonensis]|uniref:Acyl carrier protein n=1 Tax=Shewanella dokdonensis TaxID=712036 RepID=A0ABX8DFZ4_9GAMM|nr:hypothetical protein [Shewanella dokdonensis]MCL1073880.1 hypothetical protein [Shewanella dokdonensis]QVK23657.1 hypothetical protein KHX94_02735 [Shewanella dokdonensis]